MCYYFQLNFTGCPHAKFALVGFCRELLFQLLRANDPEQLAMYDLPFNAPDCYPVRGSLRQRGNVVRMEVENGVCDTCAERLRRRGNDNGNGGGSETGSGHRNGNRDRN
ncbi:hypothetical protein BDV29DRAFT_174476, partial [Aspergillus leporis]